LTKLMSNKYCLSILICSPTYLKNYLSLWNRYCKILKYLVAKRFIERGKPKKCISTIPIYGNYLGAQICVILKQNLNYVKFCPLPFLQLCVCCFGYETMHPYSVSKSWFIELLTQVIVHMATSLPFYC